MRLQEVVFTAAAHITHISKFEHTMDNELDKLVIISESQPCWEG